MPKHVIQPVLSPVGDDATTAQVDGSMPGLPWLVFPDSNDQYAPGSFHVPSSIDTAASVTFRVTLLPKTAATKNVALRLDHAPRAHGEASDVSAAWTNEDSGDIALDDTQGDLTVATWTETVANLGWAAGDYVPIRLSRKDPTADDLVGDLYVLGFQIETPDLGVLDSARWDDLRFPVQGINPPGAASDPTRNTTTGLLEVAKNATNIITGVAQMPHAWKSETDVEAHIHWFGFTAPGANDQVRWSFEYEVVEINGSWDGATYSTTSAVTADVTEDTHLYTEIEDAIDMSGVTSVSALIIWKLSRIGGHADDNYDDVATLAEIDFHYQTDTPGGSVGETSKT